MLLVAVLTAAVLLCTGCGNASGNHPDPPGRGTERLCHRRRKRNECGRRREAGPSGHPDHGFPADRHLRLYRGDHRFCRPRHAPYHSSDDRPQPQAAASRVDVRRRSFPDARPWYTI